GWNCADFKNEEVNGRDGVRHAPQNHEFSPLYIDLTKRRPFHLWNKIVETGHRNSLGSGRNRVHFLKHRGARMSVWNEQPNCPIFFAECDIEHNSTSLCRDFLHVLCCLSCGVKKKQVGARKG